MNDLRMAMRSLARTPGYTVGAFVMFVLGLGLSVFMFGGVKGYFLTSLPFPEPDRLVHVSLADPVAGDSLEEVPPRYLAEWRGAQRHFEELAGYYIGTVNLSDGDRPERYSGAFSTAGIFGVLRQPPMLGRDFNASDTRPGAPLAVAIGADLWRHRYNEDPGIIGREIRVNGQAATVVAVMPFGFRFPNQEDVWVALQQDALALGVDEGVELDVLGRVRAGVAHDEAAAALQSVHALMRSDLADDETPGTVELIPLASRYVPDQVKTVVMTLFVCVLLVLAIACSNVANLTLARVTGRRREIAIRASLGASRVRIISGVLVEVAVIAVIGAVVGLLAAEWAGAAFDNWMADSNEAPPYWVDGSTDFIVVAFAIAAALASALVAGFVPAWRASRGDLQAGLRDGGFGSSDARRGRLTRTLVVVQIVLCSVLLISAGLMLRSAANVNAVDDGLGQRNALTGRIGLFETGYPTEADRYAVFERVQAELAALPGARAATLASALPLAGAPDTRYAVDGAAREPDVRLPLATYVAAMPNYFEVFGVPLLQGRGLLESDTLDAPRVAVINAAFAAREWPGGDAVGARIMLDDAARTEITVVGVVGDFIHDGDEFATGVRPAMYVPLAQAASRFVSFAVGTAGDPHALSAPVRAAMLRAEPDTPIYWLRSFEEVTALVTFGQRLLATLFSIFATIGLLLAAVGIYAVLAYAVGQRTRELGVRRALGASDRSVVRMVVGQGGRQYLVGIGIGLVLAAGFAQAISGFLVGVNSTDPVTFGAVAALLGVVCLLASWLPVRRALKVQPMVALRQD